MDGLVIVEYTVMSFARSIILKARLIWRYFSLQFPALDKLIKSVLTSGNLWENHGVVVMGKEKPFSVALHHKFMCTFSLFLAPFRADRRSPGVWYTECCPHPVVCQLPPEPLLLVCNMLASSLLSATLPVLLHSLTIQGVEVGGEVVAQFSLMSGPTLHPPLCPPTNENQFSFRRSGPLPISSTFSFFVHVLKSCGWSNRRPPDTQNGMQNASSSLANDEPASAPPTVQCLHSACSSSPLLLCSPLPFPTLGEEGEAVDARRL